MYKGWNKARSNTPIKTATPLRSGAGDGRETQEGESPFVAMGLPFLVSPKNPQEGADRQQERKYKHEDYNVRILAAEQKNR